jgi:ABC-2 type transport system permease protein
MRLATAHTRLQLLELVRFPGFSVATLGFPSLFFLLFGLPRAHGVAEQMLASYAAFAVLGVGFFQFGVSAAIERETPWNVYVRTLPAPPFARIAGRVLSALVFATISAALVGVVVLVTTPASLGTSAWIRLAATLLLGAVPFVVLGLVIAYWTSPKSALPVANVLYLLLSYAGGLWTGPADLPHAVAQISRYTPTRQWGDLLWASASGHGWIGAHWLVLAGYTCAFGLLAAWGYRRDEGRRFS